MNIFLFFIDLTTYLAAKYSYGPVVVVVIKTVYSAICLLTEMFEIYVKYITESMYIYTALNMA